MAARPLVIVGMKRSGTTLLVESLDQHPEVVCCGELFHPDAEVRRKERFFYPERADAGAFLEWGLYALADGAAGFKLLYDQARGTNAWEYLAARP